MEDSKLEQLTFSHSLIDVAGAIHRIHSHTTEAKSWGHDCKSMDKKISTVSLWIVSLKIFTGPKTWVFSVWIFLSMDSR